MHIHCLGKKENGVKVQNDVIYFYPFKETNAAFTKLHVYMKKNRELLLVQY